MAPLSKAMALLVALGLPALAAAGVSPALEERLQQSPPERSHAVLAVMHSQVDIDGAAERPTALIRALRSRAERTQRPVTEAIDGEVTSFWLVNAFAFSGTAAEVREVAADPRVAEVDLDRTVRIDNAMINQNPFPSAPEGNWGLDVINARAAWTAFGARGAGIRVGNIDTGINANHPAIGGRVVAWRDLIGGSPVPYDDNGHGTHTAGTIAGNSAGGGAIGVAPEAQLLIAKAMDANGNGPGSALLAAAEWMTDPDGNPATADQPTVINNSWSSSTANDTWFRPMIARWRQLGIVPIFSSGNTGPGPQTIGSPASYPDVVAVGALDHRTQAASFSSRGPVIWQNLDGAGPAAGTVLTKPDLSAPGVSVVSSVGGGYLAYSGTSMAAPHVAGTVALMRQVNPGLNPDQIATILRTSAVDVGLPGSDSLTGAGRLDAYRAVAMAAGTSPAPLATTAPDGEGPAVGVRFAETLPTRTRERTLRFHVELSGEGELVRSRVNGGRWSAASWDPFVSLRLPDGDHTIEVQALTYTGVAGAETAVHRITVDATPPRIALSWQRQGRTVVFRSRANDASGVSPQAVRWSFGDGDQAVGATVRRRFADLRSRRVVVAAADSLGNSASAQRVYRPARAEVELETLQVAHSRQRRAVIVRGTTLRPIGITVRVRTVRTNPAAQPGDRLPRAMAVSSGGVVAQRAAGRTRGDFAVAIPAARLAPGTYQVEVRAGGARSVRTVRVR